MRSAADEIRRRRGDRETVFFLTGGTGFLGSHLAASLLEKGLRVILLARPCRGLAGRERVERLLELLGVAPPARRSAEVLEGQLQAPRFGLSERDYLALSRRVGEIIHCASDTSFAERKRAEVEAANLGALDNVLGLAEKSGCGFFHYLSTAYAAGKRSGVCREELSEAGAFTNVYEETKCRAEKTASERCRQAGVRLAIYRPSVVCGNSRTGLATRFNGFYFPLKTVLFLKDLFARDIGERGGEKAREMGVTRAGDGTLHLPIRVEAGSGGGVNLIPVDYFVEAFLALLEDGLAGGIFHIVSPRPMGMETLVEYTKRLFRIEGLEPCRAGAEKNPRNALELLFDSYLRLYGPYLRDERTFDDRKARAILAPRGIVCPDFDFELFSRCVSYAVECGWGKAFPGSGPSPD